MPQIPQQENLIFNKIGMLSPDQLNECEEFIDFLTYRSREQYLHKNINHINNASFNKIWNNKEDSDYDKL